MSSDYDVYVGIYLTANKAAVPHGVVEEILKARVAELEKRNV